MPPSKIGYYQIDRLLGQGGMGAVYEAVHRMTGRHVALKMLRAELAERADLQARFFNEARTTSFLEHPGIVRVFDVGRGEDGSAYMVMELCRGPTLAEAFHAETRLRVRLALVGAVADALAHAHEKGVIHRDLKPDNVIVVAGADGPMPKVLDFGIAKVLEGAVASNSPFAVKTRTGSAMGTPLYMSPEQCRGVGGITPASDVYSLGIILYECVVGRVPFDGGVGEVLVQHLTTPPPRLSEDTIVDAVPGLDPMVAAMLQKNGADRPSMKEVADLLRACAAERASFVLPAPSSRVLAPLYPTEAAAVSPEQGTHPTAPPISIPTTAARSPRRTGVILPLVLGGVVAATALAYALLHRSTGVAPAASVGPTTAATMPPSRPVPPSRPWTVDSSPAGADVFTASGKLLGRTPFAADQALEHGDRLLYLRMAGYRDETVRYDGRASSDIRLRIRTPSRPRAPTTRHDDFEVQPLR